MAATTLNEIPVHHIKMLPAEFPGNEVEGEGDPPNGSPKRKGKKRDNSALRKAPQAPKRFKSSYICFFMAKQPEIKEELGDKATVTEISKRSAELWRNLPAEERSHWDDVAAKDKQRYMVEKASYTGPWQVPWKRARKDPSAPKRPMSAFLYFSQGRRRKIKEQNPGMKNTEVSRMLGEMWRNATEEERRPHVEKEKKEREKYKVSIALWRKEVEEKKEEEQKRQQQAQQAPQWGGQYGESLDSSPQMEYARPHFMPPPGYPQYQPPAHSYPYPPQYPPYLMAPAKQPIILGPNGMPHYPPPPQGHGVAYAQPAPGMAYDENPNSPPGVPNPPNYDYDPSPEAQTAE